MSTCNQQLTEMTSSIHGDEGFVYWVDGVAFCNEDLQ